MRVKIKNIKTLILLTLPLVTNSVFSAESIHCEGKVKDSWVEHSGTLIINTTWKNSVGLCNMNRPHNNISPETCKSWASLVIAAVTTQKPLLMQYYNLEKCSDIKTYGASEKPHYVMLRSGLE
ncbi:hypothetical protein VAZ01S_062_00070 [Vibrio azureus NBRC 104587]|uniref:Uncharacterized protein n=2 Tax=Vibrio azureus TaxID=512649 RepID=U3C6T2_9VIBR|nr:hypothetical protein VAZ01S_062_00070 [Vibrio azureus NBRC 104587]